MFECSSGLRRLTPPLPWDVDCNRTFQGSSFPTNSNKRYCLRVSAPGRLTVPWSWTFRAPRRTGGFGFPRISVAGRSCLVGPLHCISLMIVLGRDPQGWKGWAGTPPFMHNTGEIVHCMYNMYASGARPTACDCDRDWNHNSLSNLWPPLRILGRVFGLIEFAEEMISRLSISMIRRTAGVIGYNRINDQLWHIRPTCYGVLSSHPPPLVNSGAGHGPTRIVCRAFVLNDGTLATVWISVGHPPATHQQH
jgi:hypothetical protein